MRLAPIFAVTALLLAACQPQAPGGGAAAPPANAPPATAPDPAAVFGAGFSARGTEPFWRVDIKGTDVTLTRPDAAAVTASGAMLVAGTGHAVWTARAGETPVSVRLTQAVCSDGMSDLKYAYAAEVIWGVETLRGCGFLTASPPTEAGS